MKQLHIVSLAAAAVVAFACICVTAPESVAAQSSAWSSKAEALLPPDAAGVVGLDLEAARPSPLYKRLETNMSESQREKLDEFAAVTSFDPRRDLNQIVAATWGAPGGDKRLFLAVLRGSFNLTDKGLAVLESVAPTTEEHRGVAIHGLKSKDASDESERRYLAILDDETALFGLHDAVVAGIERSVNGGPSLKDNAELIASAGQAAAGGQFWFVSDQPQQLMKAAPEDLDPRQAQLFTVLRSIQQTTFAANLVDGLALDWKALLGSPEDARTLADAARGLLALVRIKLPAERSDLLSLLDRFKVESEADRIDLGISLTNAEFEQLLQAVEAQKGGKPEAL